MASLPSQLNYFHGFLKVEKFIFILLMCRHTAADILPTSDTCVLSSAGDYSLFYSNK